MLRCQSFKFVEPYFMAQHMSCHGICSMHASENIRSAVVVEWGVMCLMAF